MLTYICVLSMHARVEQRKGEGESGAEESEKVREGRRQKKRESLREGERRRV